MVFSVWAGTFLEETFSLGKQAQWHVVLLKAQESMVTEHSQLWQAVLWGTVAMPTDPEEGEREKSMVMI